MCLAGLLFEDELHLLQYPLLITAIRLDSGGLNCPYSQLVKLKYRFRTYLATLIYQVKTHLQSQSAEIIAVGHQHHHTGFVHAISTTYKQFGITGLWRGVSGALARVAVGSAVQLSTFSTTKLKIAQMGFFNPGSWLIPASASMVSSIAVVTFMTPFDVVSTRLYNQGTNASGKGLFYNGFIDCFIKISKREGITGFFKGLGPHYFRIGPHTILSLLFWDQLKKLAS